MSLIIQLSDKQRLILKELQTQERYKRVYIKITVLLNLDRGMDIEDISYVLGIHSSSIYRYIDEFKQKGLDEYVSNHYKGYSGKLDDNYIILIKEHLNTHLYEDSKAIIEYIKTLTGITYSKSGIVSLLHNIGFVYKKTKSIPFKANKQDQEAFIEEFKKLENKLDKENSIVYFIDSVHPTHNTRALYGWIQKGQEYEIPTNTGRDRVNINGALNSNDPTDIIAINSDTINAQSTIELYEKLQAKNKDKDTIYVITDNAKYYKNKALNEWLESTNIKQIFLPPYSPNLNIIERLWKFLRKKVINPHFYHNKQRFKEAIENFFTNIHIYEKELKTLLTTNFRAIDSQFNLG